MLGSTFFFFFNFRKIVHFWFKIYNFVVLEKHNFHESKIFMSDYINRLISGYIWDKYKFENTTSVIKTTS